MSSSLTRRLVFVLAIVALPAIGYAQEAVLTGIVTDSTNAVLPGATVTALHEASGNTFVAVTDARGAYRVPVRIGIYKITAELSGFRTITREGVEILVGQAVAINLQMAPGTVSETVTVTGESPLIDTVTYVMGGNVDPRQVQALPVMQRNCMGLALLARGSGTR